MGLQLDATRFDCRPKRFYSLVILTIALIGCLFGASARAEVIIQYFETDWDEIYRRLPEMAEIGYEGLWTTAPCNSTNAGGIFDGSGKVGDGGLSQRASVVRVELGELRRGKLVRRIEGA